MSRRSDAIAASRRRSAEFEKYAVGGSRVVTSHKMSKEELHQHLLMLRRGGTVNGRRRDDVKGGGNRKRYATV